jgi:hypothetical protein
MTANYDDNYTCRVCGCRITAAEADDNEGMCETCAAPDEADYSEERRQGAIGLD